MQALYADGSEVKVGDRVVCPKPIFGPAPVGVVVTVAVGNEIVALTGALGVYPLARIGVSYGDARTFVKVT